MNRRKENGQPISAREIMQRIVLYLNPDVLRAQPGVTSTSPDPAFDVSGGHYFACLSVRDGIVRIAPLGSKDERGVRLEIPQDQRVGHPAWKAGACYLIHPGQVWSAPPVAVIEANKEELSTRARRNFITGDALAAIEKEIADWNETK